MNPISSINKARLRARGWEEHPYGGAPLQTPLMVALMSRQDDAGDPALALSLIEEGQDPSALDYRGCNVLWYCLKNPQMIEPLVNAGVDPNHTCDSGESVLFELFRTALFGDWSREETTSTFLAFLRAGADPAVGHDLESGSLEDFARKLGGIHEKIELAFQAGLAEMQMRTTLEALPAASPRTPPRL